ncbi:MAG: glycosyltransferase family 39 protein [Candidatus Promineifilaceae bacterium]
MKLPDPEIEGDNQLDARPAKWVEYLLVGIMLILAGILRMAAPGLSEFKADEARLLALAYDMAEGEFALRGISSSVGLPNFPASVWLYAIPASVWPHPYAATIFTGLLSTLAVALTYWFVRRYWGITAALAAGLIYAVSPWAVIFSRKIWAQNLLPFLVLVWVISAALALVEKRSRFLWLHFIALALAVQIHLAAVALVPATILLLIIFRRNIRWRDVLIGGLLALLTVIPFIYYLSRNQNLNQLIAGLSGAESGGGFSFDSIRYTIQISSGTQIHSLAGANEFEHFLALMPDLTLVHLILGVLIVSGLVYLAWNVWKDWHQPQAQVGLIVLIWLVMPALVFLWQWTSVHIHYFIAVLPAPFIAAGVAFSQIPALLARLRPNASRTSKRLVLVGGGVILFLTAVAQVGALISLQNFVSGRATPGGYGVPLEMKIAAVEQIQDLLLESGAEEVLIAGGGEAPLFDEFPAEWDVLLRDVPHRFVNVTHSALFPNEGAVVLLDGRLEPPLSTGDLYLEAAAETHEIPLRSDEGSYFVLSLPPQARPAADVALEPPILLANWVNLLGYDWPQPTGEDWAVWQVHWRSGDNPDPSDYQFFNHLINDQGQRISQVDAAAFDPSQWRAGDEVIGRFIMPWPVDGSEQLTMRVGMYRYPSLENVPLLDEAGNPYSDAADFPLDH